MPNTNAFIISIPLTTRDDGTLREREEEGLLNSNPVLSSFLSSSLSLSLSILPFHSHLTISSLHPILLLFTAFQSYPIIPPSTSLSLSFLLISQQTDSPAPPVSAHVPNIASKPHSTPSCIFPCTWCNSSFRPRRERLRVWGCSARSSVR